MRCSMLLYHRGPERMSGEVLLPLNTLKMKEPELYKLYTSRYLGREETLRQIIPFFDCLWNDVIFLSPVHPEVVFAARESCGVQARGTRKSEWFVIESNHLEQEKLLLFRNRPKWLIAREKDKAEYEPLATVSEEEKVRLPEVSEGALWSFLKFQEDALFFSYVPHVLYKGVINITGTEIITF